jgi:hypothetical protein
MKLSAKTLYLAAGAMAIIGGKIVILSSIWFPGTPMTRADLFSAAGQTLFAVGVFVFVVALINKVFIEKG